MVALKHPVEPATAEQHLNSSIAEAFVAGDSPGSAGGSLAAVPRAVAAAPPSPGEGSVPLQRFTEWGSLSDRVETQLFSASVQAKRRMRRITVPCQVVAIILVTLGCSLASGSDMLHIIPKGWAIPAAPLIGLGTISMLLALLPTQTRRIQWTSIGFVLTSGGIMATSALSLLLILADPDSEVDVLKRVEANADERGLPAWYVIPSRNASILVLFAGSVRVAWLRLPPRSHLKALWRIAAASFACVSAHYCIMLIIHGFAEYQDWETYIYMASDAVSCGVVAALLAQPRFRVHMQAWLVEHGGSVNAATAVGALVSSRPLEELLPLAKRRFRCVPLDRVTQAMMASSKPDPELAAFSEPATLGAVDAFLSHSWSDDADAKWEQLQVWRAEFCTAFGREPRVWIDKFCIDQENIVESLAGLPVFLAGCQTLVVLQGETYINRLWCLLEVFTFIVMGGSAENLEVRQLRTCDVGFDSFDARSATCFNASDKSHLLAIIETGLGTVEAFNSAVREMVAKCSSLSRQGTSTASVEAPKGKEGTEPNELDDSLAFSLDDVLAPAGAHAACADAPPDKEGAELGLNLSLDEVIMFEDGDMFTI